MTAAAALRSAFGPAAAKTLLIEARTAWQLTRVDGNEHGALVSPSGQLMERSTSQHRELTFFSSHGVYAGNIILHTHPTDAPMHEGDIKGSQDSGSRGEVVVTPHYFYIMAPGPRGFPSTDTWNTQVYPHIERIFGEHFRTARQQERAGAMTHSQAMNEAWDRTWRDLAPIIGVNYWRVSRAQSQGVPPETK
jgi:hypothetical protein